MHMLYEKGEILKGIFEKVHTDDDDRRKKKFEIPFLPNMKGESLFHLCIKKKDFKTIDDMLEFLAGYGPDHHSRTIVDLFSECFEKSLPRMLPYLNSRMLSTKDTEEIKRAALKKGSSGKCASTYFVEQDELDKHVFDPEEKIKTEVEVNFVDIPKVHDY